MLSDVGGDDFIKKGVGAIDQYNQLKNKVSNVDKQITTYGNTIDQANIFDI